jgi:hypothetical protein
LIAQLVGEESELLVRRAAVFLLEHAIPLPAEFGNRFRDGVVETSVESLEFRDGDRSLLLDGELSRRLAEVSIVADNLVDRKATLKQFASMPCGAGGQPECHVMRSSVRRLADRAGSLLPAQHLDQLRQEQRDAVVHLACGRAMRGPLGNLRAAAFDELRTIVFEEVVQHVQFQFTAVYERKGRRARLGCLCGCVRIYVGKRTDARAARVHPSSDLDDGATWIALAPTA